MKCSFLISIILVALLFTSCEKDDTDNQDKITGEWVWIKSYGGMTGGEVLTPANTGIEKTITFFRNDTVVITENGTTADKTDYFLSREKSNLFHDIHNFVTINYKYQLQDTVITLSMRYIIQKLTDTLVLEDDVVDGYGHTYVKKK
jgi:hypothetical protein